MTSRDLAYQIELDSKKRGILAKQRPAKKADLVTEIRQLRIIGAQLSNIAFNLSQHAGRQLSDAECTNMREAVRRWDDIRRNNLPEPKK